MSIEQLIVLALIQGLTEFLPISSSAHLILVPVLTDWPDQGPLVDVAVHVGSLFAVLLYFWRDVLGLFAGLAHFVARRDSFETRLLSHLAVATLPTMVAGYALYQLGILGLLRSAEVIAWTTIGFAMLLYLADRLAGASATLKDLSLMGALAIGLAQCLSLVPGTSRSGITMTMGRALGLRRTEAARFSMLLAIPVISAFGLYTAFEVYQTGSAALQQGVLIAAGLSFLAALSAIAVFMKLIERVGLTPFVIYRLVLGAGLLAYVYL